MKNILKLVSVSILSCMMALCLIVPVSAEEQSGLYEVTMDLYYAIHRFNYTYTASNKLLVISDYYDFACEDNYGGLAGVAVRTMYNAQYYGAIVPYNVRIQQYK